MDMEASMSERRVFYVDVDLTLAIMATTKAEAEENVIAQLKATDLPTGHRPNAAYFVEARETTG